MPIAPIVRAGRAVKSIICRLHEDCTTNRCHAQPTARRSIRAPGALRQPRLRHSRRVDPGTGDRQHHHGILVDRFGAAASLSRHQPERRTGGVGDGHAGSAQWRHRHLLARLPRLPRSLERDSPGWRSAGSAPSPSGDGQPARLTWGELVSGNYFEVMGVKPVAGPRVHAGGGRRQPGRVPGGGDQRPPVAQLLPLRSQDRGQDHAGQPALADDRRAWCRRSSAALRR